MVLFRGVNPIGPENRVDRGAAEALDERVQQYMRMSDEEWTELYQKMYNDRKYPGHDSLKLVTIPSLVYTGLGAAFAYELFLRRASLFSYPANIAKLALIPVFGILTFRNIDVARDIIKYRKRYPEMYQG
jgi:hypothetical protein